MRTLKYILFLLAFTVVQGNSQTDWSTPYEKLSEEKNYTELAMIYLNDVVLNIDFVPEALCKLTSEHKGTLSLNTVYKHEGKTTKIASIPFHIVILNRETNTMRLFSTEAYESIELEKIIEDCEMNDDILLVTNNKKYAVGAHRITLMWGC